MPSSSLVYSQHYDMRITLENLSRKVGLRGDASPCIVAPEKELGSKKVELVHNYYTKKATQKLPTAGRPGGSAPSGGR